MEIAEFAERGGGDEEKKSPGQHLRGGADEFGCGAAGFFLRSEEAMAHPMEAMIRAMAPGASMGAPIFAKPKFRVRLIRIATPSSPMNKDAARRRVSFCVLRMRISEMVMSAGIMAVTMAAMPDGTRCSAREEEAVVDNEDEDGDQGD